MHQHIAQEPDWLERQLAPPLPPPVPGTKRGAGCASASVEASVEKLGTREVLFGNDSDMVDLVRLEPCLSKW